MRSACLLAIILSCAVTSCELPPEYLPPTAVAETVQAAVATAQAALRTPSVTPTWTPIIVPTATNLPTATPSPTASPTLTITPTATATPTRTVTPTVTATPTRTITTTVTPSSAPTLTRTPTVILTPGIVNTTILGCDLGFDLTHGMGEVTNVYVRVRNPSDSDLTNMCLVLSASNEGQPHPDKSRCFASLKSNYEVTTKLTVDTQTSTVTLLEVVVMTNQGLLDKASGAGCRAPNTSELGRINSILNVPRPIQ